MISNLTLLMKKTFYVFQIWRKAGVKSMSKKSESNTGSNWKYVCKCGYDTIKISGAVKHINTSKNKEDHQLQRQEM